MRKKDLHRNLSILQILKNKKLEKNQFDSLIDCLDEKSIRFLCECVKIGISKKHVSSLPPIRKKGISKSSYSPQGNG